MKALYHSFQRGEARSDRTYRVLSHCNLPCSKGLGEGQWHWGAQLSASGVSERVGCWNRMGAETSHENRAKKINNKQDTRMGKDDFRKVILH